MEGGRARLTIETADERYGPLLLALRGEHQIGNAVVATTMLEAARRHGIRVPGSAITRGLETVEWPARLELLQLPNGSRVLLDAAHNPEGALALREYPVKNIRRLSSRSCSVVFDIRSGETATLPSLPISKHVMPPKAAMY